MVDPMRLVQFLVSMEATERRPTQEHRYVSDNFQTVHYSDFVLKLLSSATR